MCNKADNKAGSVNQVRLCLRRPQCLQSVVAAPLIVLRHTLPSLTDICPPLTRISRYLTLLLVLPPPPTRVVPQGRGNKFTPEDKDFFLKFILRRLKEDPSLSRNDLCELLAEKARVYSLDVSYTFMLKVHIGTPP